MESLEEERKKRINKIKRFIMIFVPFLICSLAILSISLGIINHNLKTKVSVLENTLKDLTGSDIEYDDVSGVYSSQGVDFIKYDDTSDMSADPSGKGSDAKKKIYLTFDDGPSTNTDRILDILEENDVKATFFVCAKTDDFADEAYERIVEDGHSLGMHSYSHVYSKVYASMDSFVSDFTSLQEFLYEKTGVWSRIYRFPGGSSNKVSKVPMNELIDYLNDQGITYFDWNIQSGDAINGMLTEDAIIKNCTANIDKYDECVILMHDAAGRKTTVDALDDVIRIIKARGDCEILPITDETIPIQHKKNK